MPTITSLEPFAISVRETARTESCCVAAVYVRLSRGEYVAVKDGRRTLVLWDSVKARRAKLQPARFKAPKLQPNRFHTMNRKRTMPSDPSGAERMGRNPGDEKATIAGERSCYDG